MNKLINPLTLGGGLCAMVFFANGKCAEIVSYGVHVFVSICGG